MEHHGRNPRQNVVAVIPARFGSTRLPGKLLLDISGKPMILHTLARVNRSRLVDRVIVATDDARIAGAVQEVGGETMMTAAEHSSGSDRIAEVARTLPAGAIVVNVQGDEPLIDPETIDRAVKALIDDEQADIATTFEPITSLVKLLDPNCVKVVVSKDGRALYFSRSPVPFPRDEILCHGGSLSETISAKPELLQLFKKHTGLYVYRREYLLRFAASESSDLERIEKLEQMRALEDGARIRIVEAASESIGIDTTEDLEKARVIVAEVEAKAAVARGESFI